MNSGSPFLDEIRRMVSSFSPGGMVSVSMSEVNPYLYSVLTNSWMVSVAVLIVWGFVDSGDRRFAGFGVLGAEAADGDLVARRFESARHGHGRFRGLLGAIDVVGPAAGVAVKMMMRLHVGAEAGGLAVLVDLPDEAAADQGVEAVVDGGDGDF